MPRHKKLLPEHPLAASLLQAQLAQTCKSAQPLVLETDGVKLCTMADDMPGRMRAFNRCLEAHPNRLTCFKCPTVAIRALLPCNLSSRPLCVGERLASACKVLPIARAVW